MTEPTNDNATIVEDELDTEGHAVRRLLRNNDEVTVQGLARVEPDDDDEEPGPRGARRLRR